MVVVSLQAPLACTLAEPEGAVLFDSPSILDADVQGGDRCFTVDVCVLAVNRPFASGTGELVVLEA